MTNATGGYQPPSTGLTAEDPYDPLYPGTATQGEGSTTDIAKDQAAQVGQSAKEASAQVASTAAEQAKNVAGETKRQAQDLITLAGTQVQEQASTQKDKASSSLRTLADELRSLADGGGSANPMITDLTQQAADKTREIATWLEQREPGMLLDDLRSLARRKPGTFLIGAALAGVVAGRLTRGVLAGQSDDQSDTWSSATTATGTTSPSTFNDGTDVFAASDDAFAAGTSSVTMPGPVAVEHERATAGSEFGGGSTYGDPR